MKITKCRIEDADGLAILNRQLIEDENSDNLLTVPQLSERMKEFLSGSYEAFYLTDSRGILGYALVNITVTPLYLRHFFICREQRREGLGSIFFNMLLDHYETDTMDIEAYVWNSRGIAFWESLGFRPRCIYMRLDKKTTEGAI